METHTNSQTSAVPDVDHAPPAGEIQGLANGQADEKPKLEPIAIVGMSCRLSGDVSSLDDFWEMMSRARCGWSEIPEERFSKNAYHHPNPAKMGTFNTVGGYFLSQDPALFDAPFFNITQAEAEAMDPQQRLLLECAYEAIENAGIPKERLIGRKVGVFVGGAASDYRLGTLRDLEQTPMFDATGNHQSIMSGRISHYFDLRGPSFTVDTACSSSLYALHQAVQSIRNGESEQAIVAACHWNLQPGDWVSMSLSRLFSDQGMTYAFDNRAKSGFARGEGAGALILKPLSQAIKDNDKIRSVIVNTGANQDGRTVGITSPSGKAQEQLMREVYARAGISTQDAGFVEAHGTGTKVGDPIEATAIHNVFGEGRTARSPLYIGSVKSNVGHLENASGVISIIKATMMLEKGFILPNTNFETPNENIPLAEWKMKVATLQRPWPAKKRYISVNNFGFGGSNAHCVLERGPPHVQPGQKKADLTTRPRLFVLSANDESSAKKSMDQLNIFLEQHPEVFQKGLLRNLSYTLSERRSQLSWRLAVVASTASDLAEAVASADAKPLRASQTPPKIAFVYTGQGAQWHAMGRELLQFYPVFAETVRAADECLKGLGADFSLLEELQRDKNTSQVQQAHISQPICSAVQLGLTALLKSWGITPSSVTGHSSGEIGAAYAAGVLSLEDAMAIAYFRGQAVIKMKSQYPDLKGVMMAVGAGPEEILPLTKKLTKGVVVIACENSPSSITASGDEDAIDELAAEIEALQIFNRKLRVDVAYHSPHMKLAADDYLAAIKNVTLQPSPTAAFYSSLYGKKIDEPQSALDPQYWVDNLTNPVLFSSSLKELYLDSPPDIIIEVGPHSALEGPIKQILKAASASQQPSKVGYLPTLVRGKDAVNTMLATAGSLYMKGQPLQFSSIHLEEAGTEPPTLISDLIPYPWCRQKYWSESRLSQQHRKKPFVRHDLLGLLADFSNELAPTWRNVLRTDDIPWLRDHKMQSLTTFPFAGFISMAIEAAAQRATLRGIEIQRFNLREIQVKRPLLMEDGVAYEVLLSILPYAEGTRSYSDEWDEFRIWSWEQGKGWMEHCRGMIAVRKNSNNLVSSNHRGIAARRFQAANLACKEDVDTSTFYKELDGKGATYGPTFQKLSAIRASEHHSVAVVDVANTTATMPMEHQSLYYAHPALLDQVFQLSFPILGAGRFGMSTLYMPSAIQELSIQSTTPSAVGEKIHVFGHGRPNLDTPAATDFSMDALVTPHDEEAIISLSGLCMTPVKSEGQATDTPRELCFKLEWEPVDKVDGDKSPELSHGDSGYASSVDKNSEAEVIVEDVPCPENPVAVTSIHVVQEVGSEKKELAVVNIHEISEIESASEGSSSVKDTASVADTPDLIWSDKTIALVSDSPETDPIMNHLVDSISNRTGKAISISSLENVPVSDNVHVILYDINTSILSELTAEKFSQIQKLMASSAGVMWVTRGAYLKATNPSGNMAVGLTRTVRSETAAKAATLDLDPVSLLSDEAKVDLILQAFNKVFIDDEATNMEFSENDGVLFAPRIVNDDQMNLFVYRELNNSAPYLQDFPYIEDYTQASRRLKMDIGTTGMLDTLYFKDEDSHPLGEFEVEIQVKATGMNFKDVVIAMGQLPSPYIGIECAGIISRIGPAVTSLTVGDRVCAMSEGAYSSFTRCLETSAAKIPDTMTFEIASTIPVVYCTAYYGLIELGRMCKGESVLIHAAAGGVGQAAIQLAQMVGAKVYATVGNPDKKRFIVEKYGIPEDRIFSSRDTSFGPAIREATGGAGVDVVINSLAGEFLRETWDCIAHFGRFIEIGKRDITSNTRLEMAKFNYNATFSSVDLTVLAKERPVHMARTFLDVMQLFETDKVQPIAPITVFGISEVEKAFRLLQSGKTTGKLVVVPRPGEQVKATHLKTGSLLDDNATYLIIGGTGGLGRSLSSWMVGKGARTIVLLSRSGRMEGAVAELAANLKQSAGADIIVKACDVADVDSVTNLVDFCSKELPPIRGVIHAGMVLRDVLFEKMTFEDYDAVVRSKVAGTWNIHNALLSAPLDFFIATSSAAGIVGNRGQAAYAAANTFLDAFAQYRRKLGLPAISIDLTAVTDVGYLADNASRQTEVLKNLGNESICEDEVLALFAAAINGFMTSACDNHCLTGLKLGDESTTADQLPYFAADAKFEYLRNAVLAMSSAASGAGPEAQVTIGVALTQAKSPEEAVGLVTSGLAGKLGAILMVPTEELDPETPITKYGLDSLNAIELRNWITKELSTNLQVLELLTSGSLTNLASTIIKKRAASA